jgi:hypothetical protein
MTMKRRAFSLLAGTSVAALKFGFAKAQMAVAKDPALLTTKLTPLGGERAGNADGSIPGWTGGYTTIPVGLQRNDYIPELFPEEKPILTIDARNMAQYADRLSEGVMAMMTKYGFSVQVYRTHRTASAPQYVYDNTVKNMATAQLDPGGGRLGFSGAFGGIPFPIPDLDRPYDAGAQIMWNNQMGWAGSAFTVEYYSYAVSNGQIELASVLVGGYQWPYYDPNGSYDTWKGDGMRQMLNEQYVAPQNLVGQAIILWSYADPYKHPQAAWELLNGQGRVRRAPEISFDTPSSFANGIINYDEYFGFDGSLEKYDWKCLGKKEMYIPYNNNKLFGIEPGTGMLPHFMDPSVVRFESHRCWVVEATLHPGERNVMARRRFYIDEDTWGIGLGDAWDSGDNLFHVNFVYNWCRPDLPGTVFGSSSVVNLQTGDYVLLSGPLNQSKHANFLYVDSIPAETFDPQHMAASAQY